MTVVDPILLDTATAQRQSEDRRARLDDTVDRPRLGFLGVGWIGRSRMEAVAASGVADVRAVADVSDEMIAAALEAVPTAETADSFAALLDFPLEGIGIATPSALHAEQSIAALERGLAVFCQKPLGRTAEEVRRVVSAARAADRLLGVDFSYRYVEAFSAIHELVASGEIGDVYAVDLVFHNAYGPDKPWFYDPAQAGGGCVMDLGIHLVDLAVWTLGRRPVHRVSSRLLAGGKAIIDGDRPVVEDFATAVIELDGGVAIRLACSWKLPAGCDAVISAAFYGTKGGANVRNVRGSFYDFVAERYQGTSTTTLVEPPDAWSGRAAVAWAERLASGAGFDEAGGAVLIEVAEIVDAIYGR